MKKECYGHLTLFTLFILCTTGTAVAQKVGIGTSTPQKLLSVNGSILLDQGNTNDGSIDSAALLFGTQGGVGILSKKTSAGLQNGLSLFTNHQSRLNITSVGLVGINVQHPTSPLHVGGTIRSTADIWASGLGRFDGRLAVSGNGAPEYKLYIHNGHSYLQGNLTASGNGLIGGSLNVSGDGIVENNFRVNGRMGVNGATNSNYGLIVNNANSYFQGNTSTTGNASIEGGLNVTGAAIIDNNFRVNGRIGVNGATHASYGLIVNNANSYFQGNITVTGSQTIQGSTNLQGNVTIKGNGHVRSNGSSSLRIGFSSLYTNDSYDGHGEEAKTVNIPPFEGGADNIRVTIAQFEPSGAYQETSDFKWYVYDVNSATSTCKIRIINQSAFPRVLQGTFYLMAVARD